MIKNIQTSIYGYNQKIEHILSPRNKYIKHPLSLATEYLDNGDYYTAYQLSKNIEQTDTFNNGYCHRIIGKCLLKWKSHKKAGHVFAKSIKINNTSGDKCLHEIYQQGIVCMEKHHKR